jgi:hypothetical protein
MLGGLSAPAWGLVGVTALLMLGIGSLLFFMTRGWLTLDLGWGRSFRRVGRSLWGSRRHASSSSSRSRPPTWDEGRWRCAGGSGCWIGASVSWWPLTARGSDGSSP